MIKNKAYIQNIILTGTPEEKRKVYEFSSDTNIRVVLDKFKVFARGNYPRYLSHPAAPFHDDMVMDMIKSYRGENMLEAAFRGSAKTSLKKLFDVFVLLNDTDGYRKYMKVLTKDLKNSKQIVTDVYNLIVEVKDIYGDVFEKAGDTKREETMMSFTTKDGRKYSAGTVGQTQRGHVQDAYRPDWIWFEDVEDRDSIRSMVVTESIINRIAEAIDGLSVDGNYFVTCNYISDQGTIQWFMGKSLESRITPLLSDDKDNSSVTWSMFSSAKVEQLKKDAEDFYGEYQCDPTKSTNCFFDYQKIREDLKLCTSPKRLSGLVKYWAGYKPHHRYGMGSDHSEGVGLDSNTVALFDFTVGELIVTYANNEIAPDLSAHEFARVGAEFGNCVYAPEVNNKCGGTVITTLKQLDYPRIYRGKKIANAKERLNEKVGWETNSKTKYNMFYEFKKDYNDGLIRIYDKNVLAEMKAYSNSDLKDEKAGLITRHFDLLTAVVIAWQMKEHAVQNGTSAKSYSDGYKKYIES